MHLRVDPDSECCVDYDVVCQDIACGDPLMEAVMMSLYTERQLPDCDRQGGWWADPQLGSGLHSLAGNTTNENLRLAEDTARESLEWLLEDGIVSDYTVTAEYRDRRIILDITLHAPETCRFTTAASEIDYRWVWNGYVERN